MSQLPGASIGGDKGLVSTIMMELAADANRQEDRSSPEKSSGEKSTSESVANHGDAAVGKTGDVEGNKLRQADTIFAGINSQPSDGKAQKLGDDDPSVDVIAALFALLASLFISTHISHHTSFFTNQSPHISHRTSVTTH